jgi:hypothetical protein
MRFFFCIFLSVLLISCGKKIDVQLPHYAPEIVIEMYLDPGAPLRCLLTESLPYTDSAINMPLTDATVVFSDGVTSDTLKYELLNDTLTGRYYNYHHTRIVKADPSVTYSIRVTDGTGRILTGVTRFPGNKVMIDSIAARKSAVDKDGFSVGVVISDPVESQNYYRFLAAKTMNNFTEDPSDFIISDNSFNGKQFSFYSETEFAKNDTASVRVYSLLKEHYDYIQSANDARGSNFNPFSQPGRIKSNVKGGLGIFTALSYDQRKIFIQ